MASKKDPITTTTNKPPKGLSKTHEETKDFKHWLSMLKSKFNQIIDVIRVELSQMKGSVGNMEQKIGENKWNVKMEMLDEMENMINENKEEMKNAQEKI